MESILGKSPINTIIDLIKIPIIYDAYLKINNETEKSESLSVNYYSKIKDHQNNKARHFKNDIYCNISENSNTNVTSIQTIELSSDFVNCSRSPSGNRMVVFRTKKGDNKENELLIDLYDKDHLNNTFNVTNSHGNFYFDEHFWSVSWSKNETKLAYVVENKNVKENNKEEFGYKNFKFNEDWGEKNDKKEKPQIAIFDFITNKAEIIKTKFSAGQPQIIDDNKLVYIEFDDKIKYGILYCTNRYSRICQCTINGENIQPIYFKDKNSNSFENSRCLRYNSEENIIIFLSNDVSNEPHNTCSMLVKHDLMNNSNSILVDQVYKVDNDDKSTKYVKNFPGLYVDQLPQNCWLTVQNKVYVVMTSIWRSRKVILAVDTSSQETMNKIFELSDYQQCNWKVLYAYKNYILAVKSSFSNPSQLMLGVVGIDNENEILVTKWTAITNMEYGDDAKQILENVKTNVEIIKDNKEEVEIINVIPRSLPKNLKHSPVIIHPHGGPHSTFTFEYNPIIVGLVNFGYSVIMINYVGSLGFGKEYIHKLIGKIGELDISNVYNITQIIMAKDDICDVKIDKNNIFYYGGSHGGFIGAHLISKYPELFSACCLRNPVINCGGMTLTSDIPEWSIVEMGIEWSLNNPPKITPEIYKKAYEASPIKNVENIKTPLLLLLGENDRRVPKQDSIILYRYLKSLNKTVEALLFPNTGHPLDSVEAEIYSFESMIHHFYKYRRQ